MITPKFSRGDEVQSISEPSRIGTIVEICEVHSGIQWYRVNFGSKDRPKIAEIDLRPFIATETPLESLLNGKIDGYKEFQRLITYQRLIRETPLSNNIYAFNASKTRFYPYQFKPLLKYLNSVKGRLLIADEVGLGKTIEAGLILTELRARQTVLRVLVVCPANLCEKWQMELDRRFGETFEILNARRFERILAEFAENPHGIRINGIISLEAIRRDNILEQLESVSPNFDLVIVDEAHHMRNFGRKQRAVGLLLSENTDGMLMLTATPIHLGNENLFSLLNILDDEEFPDILTVESRFKDNEPVVRAQACLGHIPANITEAITQLDLIEGSEWFKKNPTYRTIKNRLSELASPGLTKESERRAVVTSQREMSELNLLGHIFTRTKKREVQSNFSMRKAYSLSIKMTPIEKEFYETVTDFVRTAVQSRTDIRFIEKWVLHMPQRRMASSMPAMVDFYRKHLGLDESDKPDDLDWGVDESNGAQEKSENQDIREKLRRILRKWPSSGRDSKYESFITILRELRKNDEKPLKIMVFSFFKDTLKYLSRSLSRDGFKNLLISGDVHPSDRTVIVEKFRITRNIEILLSSKVGGEGLDFQYCDTMFNYDLPWNPMEVEQRIGRLDRLGQESPVIRIYNFYLENTIEEAILKRLYDRIDIFTRSIGELEHILGEELNTLEDEILSCKLTREEEEQLIEQKARAILNRYEELKNLETNAAEFIGTDQYFDEEIKSIIKMRRYVTGEQMRHFILDFLKLNCSKCRLVYDNTSKKGLLYPDEQLGAFIADRRVGYELASFSSAGDYGIPITFDSQTAFDNPRMEFISVLHPLTQMIAKYYSEDNKLKSTAHHVVLRTPLLRSGLYMYFIFRLRVTAAKTSNSLEMVVIDGGNEPACDDEVAEELMGEMVERGEESKGPRYEVDRELMEKAYHKATEIFLARVKKIREETEKTNNIFIERRLESLKVSFEKKIGQKKDQVDKGTREGKSEQYLRMIRAVLRRLEDDYQQKIREIDKARGVGVSYDQVAAGILEAVSEIQE